MFSQILIEFLGLLPLATLVGIVVWKKRQLDLDDRRDPITTELRNFPGASLQGQIEKLDDARVEQVIIAVLMGLGAAHAIAMRRMDFASKGVDLIDGMLIVGAFIFALLLGIKITRDMPNQRKLRQGMRAEHATAQEVSAALAGDNRIFHDIKATDFNIDHVVITPVGIFAVETKSRLKPPAGNGAAAVKVRYDGKQLEFPGWKETKPVEQAMRQAKWLSDYLSKSTGDSFPVTPVLALPGWFVENTARITDGMVRVINPKKSQWLFLPEKQPVTLDAAAIQRASFAIEKLSQQGE